MGYLRWDVCNCLDSPREGGLGWSRRSVGLVRIFVLAVVFGCGAVAYADDRRAAVESEAVASGPVAVPEPTPEALRFHRGNNAIWAFNRAWALLLTGGLAFSGLSARVRNLARRLSEFLGRIGSPRGWKGEGTGPSRAVWFLTVGIYIVLYLTIVFVIDLPLHYYEGFVRLHAFGLSNQTFGKWLHDVVTRLGVSMAVGFALAWVPFALMVWSPKRWWLYLGLLSVPFLFVTMLVEPVWIDPLLNRFGPMKNPDLERQILELAARAGIDGSHVFEVEKSVDTKAMNAYVTGFLWTKRIVLWDTLLAKLDPPEVLAVMGHEMGHYVLGHVVRSILLGSLVILAGLFFVDRAGRSLIARFSSRLGFDRLADIASVPLILMLMHLSSLFLGPVVLAYSRYQEHEADRFALDLTGANRPAASAFVKFQAENLGVPRPDLFYWVFRASHPSPGERIDFCNTYRPQLMDPNAPAR